MLTFSASTTGDVDDRHVAVLLDPVEAWARSYAQSIVNRSDSPALRASLNACRGRIAGRQYYPQQWEDDDFGPIEAAIEELFRRLGWRRSLKP